jgi:tetratricopeptide (TPR) repeat protein
LIVAATSTADQVDGDKKLAAHEALAEAYNVVTHACVKFDVEGVDWISAERAVTAARVSGSPLAEGEATRTLCMLARRAGHHNHALDRAVAFADRLQGDGAATAPEHLSVRGILLTNAGYTAAKAGDRAGARDLFSEADAIARRLGQDRNDRWTAFGPTNVTLFRISAAFALGDFGTAIDLATSVPAGAIRLPERQARYWVDVARAYHQWDKPEECYRALRTAERLAPEEVRARPVVRSLIRSLLSSPAQRSMPELRDIARRTRVDS